VISCQRLALTPLSYLWQRNQGELLSEMIMAGMEAIIIKVAGIGLDTTHLGKTLSEMQPKLVTLVRGTSFISIIYDNDGSSRIPCMARISVERGVNTRR
jgi:diphthamide synthase (EF-2-diphthine--ammonia ligase)